MNTVHESEAEIVEPYVPAGESLPELTIKTIVLGVLLSMILAGANAYLGLKVGMTVSASIPAAVLSMGILRLFRDSNILENNLIQTAASAGESLAAGVIFTLPALIILGYWDKFEFLPTMCIALFGGSLGVMFTIPLRRALIIEAKLKFPEGVATGEVLKAGQEGGGGAKLIAVAAIVGAIVQFLQRGVALVSGSIHGGISAGRVAFGVGSELGVSLLAVGYIVGLNIAVLVLAGGVISWAFGIPLYMALASPDAVETITGGTSGYEAAAAIWSAKIRYLGVGAMATGGIYALLSLVQPIRDGVRSSLAAVRAARSGTVADLPRTERDIPIHIVLWGTLALALPILVVFFYVVDADALGISGGLHATVVLFGVFFALFAGFLFSSVAGYMAGLVGSSNNPISGVTIATVLTISLVLLGLLGGSIDFTVDTGKALVAAATAILVGGVVCCAAAIAGDNMQDLKAGQIVGATPAKQQVMQVLGVAAAAIVLAPILQLLFEAYGLGSVMPRPGMDPTSALHAPQAELMASVSKGVLTRNLPWLLIAIGALIAVAIILFDARLKARNSTFRAPVLAVAVGIYLPIELSVPIFVGGLIAHFAGRRLRAEGLERLQVASANRRGLLFASGLITGEALLGIALAVPYALKQDNTIFQVVTPPWYSGVAEGIGLALFVALALWLYKIATRAE